MLAKAPNVPAESSLGRARISVQRHAKHGPYRQRGDTLSSLLSFIVFAAIFWYFAGDEIRTWLSMRGIAVPGTQATVPPAINAGPGSDGGVCVDSSVASLMKKIVGEKMEHELSMANLGDTLARGIQVDITKVDVVNMRTLGGNVGTGRRTCFATIRARAEWTGMDGQRHWRESVVPLKIEYQEAGFSAAGQYSEYQVDRNLWANLTGNNLSAHELEMKSISRTQLAEDEAKRVASAPAVAASELPVTNKSAAAEGAANAMPAPIDPEAAVRSTLAPAPTSVSVADNVSGIWTGSYHCGPTLVTTARSNAPFDVQVTLRVVNGEATLDRLNATNRESSNGTLDRNHLVLRGRGAWNDDPGREWATLFEGTFDGNRFAADGDIQSVDGTVKFRKCALALNRQE